jgi:predicted S18 family serine protease
MNNKYSFIVFNQLKEELNLRLLENYDEKQKYISTSKFCMKCTYESCENSLIIKFDALLRSKKAYCKTHRYNASGDKVSKTKLNSNKQIYDENRKKLLKLIEELNTELIGDYSSVIECFVFNSIFPFLITCFLQCFSLNSIYT